MAIIYCRENNPSLSLSCSSLIKTSSLANDKQQIGLRIYLTAQSCPGLEEVACVETEKTLFTDELELVSLTSMDCLMLIIVT